MRTTAKMPQPAAKDAVDLLARPVGVHGALAQNLYSNSSKVHGRVRGDMQVTS